MPDGPQFLSHKILCHVTLITAEIIVQEPGRGDAAHSAQESHIKEIEFKAIFLRGLARCGRTECVIILAVSPVQYRHANHLLNKFLIVDLFK